MNSKAKPVGNTAASTNVPYSYIAAKQTAQNAKQNISPPIVQVTHNTAAHNTVPVTTATATAAATANKGVPVINRPLYSQPATTSATTSVTTSTAVVPGEPLNEQELETAKTALDWLVKHR